MKKRVISDKIARLVKLLYLKLFRINDSPLKIAFGFGLGAFIGVMPGIGPVGALLLAFIFRVNRASALLSSLLFNTWVGLIVLLPAVKIGSAVMGLSYPDVYADVQALLKDFHWARLFQTSVFDLLIPVMIGYFIVALSLAVLATIAVYLIVRRIRKSKLERLKSR